MLLNHPIECFLDNFDQLSDVFGVLCVYSGIQLLLDIRYPVLQLSYCDKVSLPIVGVYFLRSSLDARPLAEERWVVAVGMLIHSGSLGFTQKARPIHFNHLFEQFWHLIYLTSSCWRKVVIRHLRLNIRTTWFMRRWIRLQSDVCFCEAKNFKHTAEQSHTSLTVDIEIDKDFMNGVEVHNRTRVNGNPI